MKCRLVPSNGNYEVITPYDRGFVIDLKNAVPANERNYDPNTHRWTVAARYGNTIAGLIAKHFDGQWVNVPAVTQNVIVGIIELLYLGKTKDRGNGEKTAYGWTHDQNALVGGWNVIFPERVLKIYFGPSYTEQTRKTPETYYETLGIKRDAGAEEIRSGYRRMVRQWHPDVCKDPDAHEVFIGIQKAYETLNNPRTKARYDVGLKISANTQKSDVDKYMDFLPYRAPLKCGNLLCEYLTLGIRRTVTKILQWEDIYNEQGKVLVSSWAMGDNEPTLEWR